MSVSGLFLLRGMIRLLRECPDPRLDFRLCGMGGEADAPFHSAFGASGFRISTVRPSGLLPDVQNTATFLPAKSPLSRKVSMMCGALYHQSGKPMITVS